MKGKYNEERKYSAGLDIASYEVDSQFRLKPASFMDMAQEIAYLAATEMGFGYDDLQEKGVVWVLSRMCSSARLYKGLKNTPLIILTEGAGIGRFSVLK